MSVNLGKFMAESEELQGICTNRDMSAWNFKYRNDIQSNINM